MNSNKIKIKYIVETIKGFERRSKVFGNLVDAENMFNYFVRCSTFNCVYLYKVTDSQSLFVEREFTLEEKNEI